MPRTFAPRGILIATASVRLTPIAPPGAGLRMSVRQHPPEDIAMTPNELLLVDFDFEMHATRRTLERIPEPQALAAYKPHDKSMPLGKLAMHLATLPSFARLIFTLPGLDLSAPSNEPRPSLTFTTTADCLAAFDKYAAEARAVLSEVPDVALGEPWPFSFGEHVISNHSRALTYRVFCLNHLVHHRAQIGVYLRLNDCPVPATYGPSADEQTG